MLDGLEELFKVVAKDDEELLFVGLVFELVERVGV